MPKNQQTLIYVLLGVIVVMFGYIVMTHNNSAPGGLSERDLRRIEQRVSDKKSGGQSADPYEKNEVKNSILKNAADPIQVCYKEWFAAHPAFTFGRIVVDWTIESNGTPRDVEIVSSDIPDINKCVVDAIAKIKFPPPPENEARYINHKFFFKREEKEDQNDGAKELSKAPAAAAAAPAKKK